MPDPAGTKIVEEPKKRKIRPPPVIPDTRKKLKSVRNHIIQENVGRDPPESRCNLSVDLCKNSGTFLKMPKEFLVVDFSFNHVFGRFVMQLDLADPNFADFRFNSTNII